MPATTSSRLGYIDWLRGLACVLMFQTHCYDAWLGGSARDSRFAMWSHLLGTFPAPLFLFLAGISVALIADRMLQKGASASQIGTKVIFRGAEILGLGLLFRLQEYVIAWGWAPWADLLRVDVLNVIGVSIMLMGALCWMALKFGPASTSPRSLEFSTAAPAVIPEPDGVSFRGIAASHGHSGLGQSVEIIQGSAPQERPSLAQDGSPGNRSNRRGSPGGTTESRYAFLAGMAFVMATLISAVTPLLWTTWRPRFFLWELESYINGVHNLGTPQPWLFPIFPWTGFAFAGLALGFVLSSAFSKTKGGWLILLTGIFGVVLVYAAKFVDSLQWQLYPVYDYWHTSPAFFATRIGLLLILLLAAYAWCRWGLGQVGFSPMIQLGKTSLLVYWVHIELVYGRFHILPPRSQTVLGASKGLLTIFLLMLVLSLVRTTWKNRMAGVLPWRKLSRATI